jgi:hypothetical protein
MLLRLWDLRNLDRCVTIFIQPHLGQTHQRGSGEKGVIGRGVGWQVGPNATHSVKPATKTTRWSIVNGFKSWIVNVTWYLSLMVKIKPTLELDSQKWFPLIFNEKLTSPFTLHFPVVCFYFTFFCELYSTSGTLTTHEHSSRWTHAQSLPLEASSKNGPTKPQDWRSHHRRLAVMGTSLTTESTNAIKSWEIRSHGKSNSWLDVLLELFVTTKLQPLSLFMFHMDLYRNYVAIHLK